mgnify:FL=1|jgi:Ribonuclease G/E
MSKKQDIALITAPLFGTGRETLDTFYGHSCGYCQGRGWFLDAEIINEQVKKPCPSCGGTGKVKAVVTIEWLPDGEVKPYFKEDHNHDIP